MAAACALREKIVDGEGMGWGAEGSREGTSPLTISEEGMFFPVIYLLCVGVPLFRALLEEIS